MANREFAALPPLGSSNWRVRMARKLQQKKHRESSGFTVIEGTRLIETAVSAGRSLEMLVVSERISSQWPRQLGHLASRSSEIFRATDDIMQRMSPTVTPPGVLAVLRVPRQRLPEPPYDAEFTLLCLDGVSDPGNAGTLIRTADAAGAQGVLGFGGVDLWGPKAVRATMGSSFHLPVVEVDDGSGLDILSDLQQAGCRVICASPHAQDTIWDADLTGPCVLVLGNEAWGPSAKVAQLSDAHVGIPILGRAESLNVAQAGAVILYEIARQKDYARCFELES